MKSRRLAKLITAICAVGVTIAMTGCATGATSTAGTHSKFVDVKYNGPESGFPEGFPVPKKVDGKSFVVGYLDPFAAVAGLKAVQDAAQKETEALGGTFIAKDAALDPQLQVTQFNELLAQGVDVIVGYPLNPESWTASIKAANAKGVPVFVTSTPWDFTQHLLPGVVASVGQAFDMQTYEEARAVAQKKPGANFVILNTGPRPGVWCKSRCC